MRGNNRRRLFSYPRERLAYLRVFAKALVRHECKLHGACLMCNHLHALLTPPTVSAASDCMKQTNQRYAQIRNAARRGSGKLFEQSFHSEPIENEHHLSMSVMYIDANPQRAGMRNSWTYPWSTYAFHAGGPSTNQALATMISPDAWYLGLGESASERARAYRAAFSEYLAGGVEPKQLARIAELEREVSVPYTRRLLRPDGSSAAEVGFYVSSENDSANEDLEG